MNEETVLRKKKIAVISKRRNVSDFFRLEAESCSCLVSVTPVVPSAISEYDIIILDDGIEADILGGSEKLYRITADNAESGKNTLTWPVSVRKVREIFEGYVVSETKEKETAVIYLRDGKEKAVSYKNMLIPLTEYEWRALACLSEAEGGVVSREELRKLFNATDGNITDVYICHLRRKLEAPFGERLIRTVRGKGYSLTIDARKE